MNPINITIFQALLHTNEYKFLKEDPRLNDNIILLALGGSHAYGTNVEGSDVDVRGCALNSKEEILLGRDFEQVINNPTDTTIYSFKKLVGLLTACNPNCIEILGCKPEHYLHISPVGQELIDNAHLFLSQRAFHSFGGYATAQLRRLENKVIRDQEQEKREQHILNSIKNAKHSFSDKYFLNDESAIELYIDEAIQEGYTTEIFMNLTLEKYPLRDYAGMLAEMQEIIKSYSKIGKRNERAFTRGQLGKHQMHLVRLYLMCIDILTKEKIVTYREEEHKLLMDIRFGKYLTDGDKPTDEFMMMVDDYEKELEYAKNHTSLPLQPEIKKIDEFVINVHERIIKGKLNI